MSARHYEELRVSLQYDRVHLEKQLLERTNATLEEKNRLVVVTNDQLNAAVRELKNEVHALRAQNERLKAQVYRKDRINIFVVLALHVLCRSC